MDNMNKAVALKSSFIRIVYLVFLVKDQCSFFLLARVVAFYIPDTTCHWQVFVSGQAGIAFTIITVVDIRPQINRL